MLQLMWTETCSEERRAVGYGRRHKGEEEVILRVTALKGRLTLNLHHLASRRCNETRASVTCAMERYTFIHKERREELSVS